VASDDPAQLSAYIDESVHDDHGLYVIGAVLAPDRARPLAERDLTGVRPDLAPPHWHVEAGGIREKLVAVVRTLPIEARVCACAFERPSRQEAARARALRWFVSDLDVELEQLVLDRREHSQNADDRRLLTMLLGSNPRFRYRHARFDSEPLLWVADIVAGAVAATWVRGCDHITGGLDRILSASERESG